jgi:FkbM family methyltransferase
LYRAGAQVLAFTSTVRREGIAAWLELRRLQATRAGAPPVPVVLRTLAHPILVRPGTADAATIIDNVVRDEYTASGLPSDLRWMIDAGGYIGDTAAVFLSRFPSLKVIVLEPEATNYEMAVRNLAPYGERAIVLRKALWFKDEVVHFEGGGTAGSIGDGAAAVDGISVPTIMAQHSIPVVDVLKIDIEGAETAVFSDSGLEWLSRVGRILIEIHGPEAMAAVSLAMRRNGFLMTQFRSVWSCVPGR